jgi:O-antigen/teichoic acid export membrane protein
MIEPSAGAPLEPLPSTVMMRAVVRSGAIARGVAAGGVHIAVSVLTIPLQTALLLRYLSSADAGFWFVALSITQYLALFDLGVGPTLTRFLALSRGAQAPGEIPFAVAQRLADLIRCARALYLALAAGLVLAAVACIPVLPRLVHHDLSTSNQLAWLFFATGSAINLMAAVHYASLAGFGIVGINRFARAIAQVVGLAVMAVGLRAGFGLPAAALAWLLQNVLLFVVGQWFVRRSLPEPIRRGGRASMALVGEMVRPSLQWAGMNLGAMLILMPGSIIVSWRLGPAAVPAYAALSQFGGALATLVLLPTGVTEPFVSEAFGARRMDQVAMLLLRNVRVVVGTAACGVAMLAVFGPALITTWVGAAHFAGTMALYLMLALYLLEVHHVVHASAVMATGRLVFLKPALLAGVLNVVLGVWLVGRLGIVGVILATVIAQLITNNWLAPYISLREFGISLARYARVIAPLVGLGAVAVVVSLIFQAAWRSLPSIGATLQLAGGIGATLLAMLPAFALLVLTPGERTFCRTVARRGLGLGE